MEGADESTELRLHPSTLIKYYLNYFVRKKRPFINFLVRNCLVTSFISFSNLSSQPTSVATICRVV